VRFKYEEEEVLKGINLNFEKGKTYALVGESGSGKSTLADLVPRFNDVTDGVIKVDGKDVREINIQSLRRLTGIVTQDSILFNDTVRQNLSLGVEDVSDEDFTKALKIANAYDFVSELDHGIDSVIGEGGGKLSGGQRQRLCIARAVLLNPPLLILDEATSALDTASEKLVQEALEKVMEGRTAIVIAHRLSTIRNADKIVVLDKGNIAEEGSHDELFAKQGHYYKLCNLQNIK
jgi:subfamily B ATP-binding cassette protein MsbA